MKKIALLAMFILAGSAFAKGTYVHSYTRKDGTFVQSHHKTTPDNSKYNNYSTKGNTNPYTGKEGDKDPEDSK